MKIFKEGLYCRTYRGRIYTKLGCFEEAIEDLSLAVHLNPSDWLAFYHRGFLLRRIKPQMALRDLSTSGNTHMRHKTRKRCTILCYNMIRSHICVDAPEKEGCTLMFFSKIFRFANFPFRQPDEMCNVRNCGCSWISRACSSIHSKVNTFLHIEFLLDGFLNDPFLQLRFHKWTGAGSSHCKRKFPFP